MAVKNVNGIRVLDTTDDEYIERFQQHLSAIRGISRMTATELGNETGLESQTIGELESGTQKMSRVQYLALHSVFSERAVDRPQIACALIALVYYPIEEEAAGRRLSDCRRAKKDATWRPTSELGESRLEKQSEEIVYKAAKVAEG